MSGIQETVSTNRKYKDRLFRLRFGSEEYKADVLCLYNAINETTNTWGQAHTKFDKED